MIKQLSIRNDESFIEVEKKGNSYQLTIQEIQKTIDADNLGFLKKKVVSDVHISFNEDELDEFIQALTYMKGAN